MNPPALAVKRKIKSFSPLQLGKILGILYGALGLLVTPIFAIMAFVTPELPESQRAGFFAFGIGFALLAPVMYAAMGFITGTLGAVIYNLVAKWVGGIEVEVE